MPLYEHKCEDCGHTETTFYFNVAASRLNHMCTAPGNCYGNMVRQWPLTNFNCGHGSLGKPKKKDRGQTKFEKLLKMEPVSCVVR